MKKLVIDRSKWRTGGGGYNFTYGETKLLNDMGYMCCLGFYCVQIGNKTKNEIYGITCPSHLDSFEGVEELVKDGNHLNDTNSDFSESAIYINDSDISNEERERQLKELFKKNGVDLKFVGKHKK
jgi:hypothetical protein